MHGSPWAGSEELWTSVAQVALQQGYELSCSLFRWPQMAPKIEAVRAKGAEFHLHGKRWLPSPDKVLSKILGRTTRVPWTSTALRFSSFASFFASKPDVICISQGGTYDTIYYKDLWQLLTASSVPYIVVSHLNTDFFAPESEYPTYAVDFFGAAYRCCFVSQHNLQATERQLATSLSNAIVVQNPVNLAGLDLVKYPQEEEVRFASVARLDAGHKGQDILFEALAADSWRDRKWRLQLFGVGPNEQYLRRLAQFYGISARVEFCGHVNRIETVWEQNQVLLLGSRYEGTPISLIEAMVAGRPSVVTDVGGNSAWLTDGESGFLAEAATARSFGKALERAWDNRKHWESMGLRAHDECVSRIDPDPGATLLNLIEEAAFSKAAINNSNRNSQQSPILPQLEEPQ